MADSLNYKQRIAAYELLKLHTTVIGQNASGENVVKFEDGWSDQRIADEVGKSIAIKSVSNTRRDLIGHLQGVVSKDQVVDKDIAALTELVSELRGDLNRAIRSINMLAKTEGLTAALIEEKSNGR